MRILITGAGGAAAVSVWKSLSAEHELYMADIDPLAAGLYLVPPERLLIIPRGDAPELVPALPRLTVGLPSPLLPLGLSRLLPSTGFGGVLTTTGFSGGVSYCRGSGRQSDFGAGGG